MESAESRTAKSSRTAEVPQDEFTHRSNRSNPVVWIFDCRIRKVSYTGVWGVRSVRSDLYTHNNPPFCHR